MLGMIGTYVVTMFFTLRSDKEVYPTMQSPFYKLDPALAGLAAAEVGLKRSNSPNNSDDTSGDTGGKSETKDTTKGGDEGCCRCCGCCQCCSGGKDSSSTSTSPSSNEKGMISTLLSKYPLTKSDKATLTFCTVLSNIVFSASFNHHDILSQDAAEYFIGLISGSVALPIMTIITLLFTRIPRKNVILAYATAYAFCIACFVVTLIYTVRLEQTEANKWLVSTAISNLQDVGMVAVSYFMIYFCPAFSCLTSQKQSK